MAVSQAAYRFFDCLRVIPRGQVGFCPLTFFGGHAFDYDAYGNLLGSLTPQTDLLYAGEMIDPYLGWYYNRARWYEPATGRFNTTDPFAGSHEDPQSLHKYLYAHDNPINNTDPTASIFRRSMRLCLANESGCRLVCPPSSPGDWCGVAED